MIRKTYEVRCTECGWPTSRSRARLNDECPNGCGSTMRAKPRQPITVDRLRPGLYSIWAGPEKLGELRRRKAGGRTWHGTIALGGEYFQLHEHDTLKEAKAEAVAIYDRERPK